MESTFYTFLKNFKIIVVIKGGQIKYQCSQQFLLFRENFKINVVINGGKVSNSGSLRVTRLGKIIDSIRLEPIKAVRQILPRIFSSNTSFLRTFSYLRQNSPIYTRKIVTFPDK
jgi:hypothetical protein